MNDSNRLPQLDSLRGIAVLLVMLFHAGVCRIGWVGVDLFFVLSGFLITGILLNTKGRQGYFLNFYTRRILRIWPLYYALLFLTFVIVPLVFPAQRNHIFGDSRPWLSYLFFLQNWWMNPSNVGAGPVAITWSLAIEEQFYIVWPLMVALAPPIALRFVPLAVLVTSPVLRLANTHWGLGYDPYRHTAFHLDAIAVGCAIALWPRMKTRFAAICLVVALCVTIALPHQHPLQLLFVAITMGSVVTIALNTRWLSNQAWLRYCGTISYCLYLVHIPIFGVIKLKAPILAERPLALVVAFLLCFGFAAISWHFFERPILSLKRYFEYHEAGEATAVYTQRQTSNQKLPYATP